MWGTGILKGMRITMRNMLRGPITVQYPHEKRRASRARALGRRARSTTRTARPSAPRASSACARAPTTSSRSTSPPTEDGSKHIDRYRYEIGACMMCGLCVEACPFDAIEMSHEYELARTDPAELAIDLLADVPAAQPKRKPRGRAAAATPQPPRRAPQPARPPSGRRGGGADA